MDDEKQQQQIKKFKILMLLVAAFAALFPLYQCTQAFTRL